MLAPIPPPPLPPEECPPDLALRNSVVGVVELWVGAAACCVDAVVCWVGSVVRCVGLVEWTEVEVLCLGADGRETGRGDVLTKCWEGAVCVCPVVMSDGWPADGLLIGARMVSW